MAEKSQWQPWKKQLFCQLEKLNTYEGKLHLPGKQVVERIFRVTKVGEGVEGIKVGDAVVTKSAHECVFGYFIDIDNVLGVLPGEGKAADAA